ncbi:MAG: amphi-Trp domain-containing protein [Ardenticatenaceae bacterium]|nr:amphi-Trp domain-containing protein [Ardenticatenaceae bacterium]
MKSNLTGSLSRTEFAARLRNLADEIESGTLKVEDETLTLPEQFKINQTATTTQRKATYSLKLDWAATLDGNGTKSTPARKRTAKKTAS